MFQCPRCKNEEFDPGSKYCKICGLKLDGEVKTNENDDIYLQKAISDTIKSDKKENIAYWDNIDNIVQNCLEEISKQVGINVNKLGTYDDVKELEEHLVGVIERRFEVKFPYNNQYY